MTVRLIPFGSPKMSTIAQYADEELVKLAIDIRTKHLKLKDLIHLDGIRLQQKVKTRTELISDAKVFTKMRDHAISLVKEKSNKLKLVQVNDTLASFLRLNERNFSPIYNSNGEEVWYYSGNLMLSYFVNWVVSTGRHDGKNVKLFGPNDPFVKLFKDDLLEAGIVDEAGEQVAPFPSNKHMRIFTRHYPNESRLVGKDYSNARIQISESEHPDIYQRMESERTLLKGEMGKVRNAYRDSCKKYQTLIDRRSAAEEVGDTAFDTHLSNAYNNMAQKTRTYMALLNKNGFEHSLRVSQVNH